MIYGGKDPAAGTAGVAEDGEQTVRVIFLPAEEFLQIEEQPAGEPEELESRYAPVTEEERELIARIVYLEARGEPAEGQQAVAEVILNRVAAENFPDTVADVVYQENPQQFTTAPFVDEATPGADQYAAVDAAINGEAVLPMDVVYFSRERKTEMYGEPSGDMCSAINTRENRRNPSDEGPLGTVRNAPPGRHGNPSATWEIAATIIYAH